MAGAPRAVMQTDACNLRCSYVVCGALAAERFTAVD
jgi:hypothetical protein